MKRPAHPPAGGLPAKHLQLQYVHKERQQQQQEQEEEEEEQEEEGEQELQLLVQRQQLEQQQQPHLEQQQRQQQQQQPDVGYIRPCLRPPGAPSTRSSSERLQWLDVDAGEELATVYEYTAR